MGWELLMKWLRLIQSSSSLTGRRRKVLLVHKIFCEFPNGATLRQKQGELAAVKQNVALTTGMIGSRKIPLPDRWGGRFGLSPWRIICNGLNGCHRRRSLPMTVQSISNISGA